MRTSPLKRRTPLRNYRPIKKQSNKQRRREDGLRRTKTERIKAQIEFIGYASCAYCPVKFYTLETARIGLELHHVVFRSHGGTDEPSNLELACFACHKSQHGIHVVREWRHLPVDDGGFDLEAGND